MAKCLCDSFIYKHFSEGLNTAQIYNDIIHLEEARVLTWLLKGSFPISGTRKQIRTGLSHAPTRKQMQQKAKTAALRTAPPGLSTRKGAIITTN